LGNGDGVNPRFICRGYTVNSGFALCQSYEAGRYVLDDETVRLSVTPEVSTIDESLGTTLVLGGDPVPGLNTRKANTTVELRQGQTLAIAGLLSVEIDGQTDRVPGLGDLPYIGPLFSNTGHDRQEKELLVLVTPYLVSPMDCEEVPPLPNDGVEDPNDLEP
jgi:pilus assembly protein CpaC